MSSLAMLALLVLVDRAPAAADRPAADSTPFELAPPHGIVVPAMVNGAGPFLFLLDTGSSHSVIADDLARLLRAPAVSRTVVASPTGEDIRTVVRLERLELGPAPPSGVLPTVVRRAAIDDSGRVRGLIGQDVLAGRRYTIDFRARRIVWHRDPVEPDPARPALTLEFEAGRFLATLPQSAGVLRLVPDSGAGQVVLFQHERRPLLPVALMPGTIHLTTLSGHAAVRQATVREFRVGAATLRDVPVVLVERRAADAPEGDGLLPLDLFELVTFDGPQRLLILGKRVR